MNRYAIQGFFIWLITSIYFCYDNLICYSVSAMSPELAASFQVSATALGSLSAAYLWSYGLMQLPAGVLLDRYGPHRVLSIASLIAVSGVWLFCTASNIVVANLGRLLVGCGAGFAVTGAARVAVNWFSAQRFALFLGLTVTLGYIFGAASSVSITKRLLMSFHHDWRLMMRWAFFVGIFIFCLLLLIVRDKPADQQQEGAQATSAHQSLSIGASLMIIMKSMQSWAAAIYAALIFVPVLAFAGLWGAEFFVNGFGLDRLLSGKLVSLTFIGFAIGAPIMGWFSDYIGLRKLPMIIANIAILIVSMLIIYGGKLPVTMLAILLFAMGFFASGMILAFVVVRESYSAQLSATSIGFMNTLNTFGGALVQILVGVILDKLVVGKSMIFNIGDYRRAFLLIPASLLIALLFLSIIKETHCRSASK